MPFYVDKIEGEEKPKVKAPAAGPRPDKGPMSEDELRTLVSGLISAAASYVDGELSPERAIATDYYMGRLPKPNEPGRSSFVSTEVRDGIQAVLPAMLRVVFGAERAVEFTPHGAEDVDATDQATDYVHLVFAEDNPGFLNTHGWIKDGLTRQIGVAKWWWDDTTEISGHKAENVDDVGLELLAADEEIEITRIVPTGQSAPAEGEQPMPLYTVEFTRTVKDGRARWEIIPPEEYLFNRESRSKREAVAMWHRTRKTRGELIALGVPKKMIDEHGGDDPSVKDNVEVFARNPEEMGSTEGDTEAGKANEKHLYCEGFARIDYDGDGIAEVRRICTLGPGHYPVDNEPVAEEDINFAVFIPDPEPHTMKGLSWADRLMDLQRYKSMLMRGLSDSLALSIFPRVVYQQGNANLADILNNQPGAPIRASGDPNTALREFSHSFVGKEALPVIDLVDTINERRTGQNRGVTQLDADALQSSTPAAVGAAISASQAQQELLVRIFAETGLKPLFKGLLRLLVTHQPRPRVVRLRNRWISVDPRAWNVDMDATVNVALGSGLVEEKVQTLMGISDKQFQIIEALGPQNPIVGLKEVRDTLAEIAELRGKKNSAKYFKPVSQQELDAMAAEAAKQPPPPSPEMMLAQAQIQTTQMKTQADIQRDEMKAKRDLQVQQAKMAMDWKQMQMEDARERERQAREDDRVRDKQAAEYELELKKLQLEHNVSLNEQQINADVELTRATTQSGPSESGGGEEAAPRPKRKRRHVTVDRGDGRPPLRAIIEDHEDDDEPVGY